ncbi:MAG: FkbM family methyltransferase [Candidatus Omnitrophota bacterium]
MVLKLRTKISSVIGKIKFFTRAIVIGWFRLECVYDHFFIRTFNQNTVIVDFGAGKGEFAAYITGRFPHARVFLAEANPDLAQKLIDIFGAKGNVTVANTAIGAHSASSVKFYLSRDLISSSLYESLSKLGGLAESGACEVTISMHSLNDFFALYNLDRIDLLKIDIEGAEFELFENFSKRDFTRVTQISVEFHDFLDPLLRDRMQSCVDRLQKLGYSCIHAGINFMYGSEYYNCLFYDRKRLGWNNLSRYLKIPQWLYR